MSTIKTVLPALLLLSLVGCQLPVNTPVPDATVKPAFTHTAAPVSKQTPTPAVTSTQASLLGVDLAQLKGINVRFWFSGSDALIQAMQSRAAAFNKSNPWGIQVDTSPFGSPGAITDQVGAAMTAEQRPDVVLTYPELASSWENGEPLLVDLNPYISDPLWGLSAAEQSDFPADWWSQESDTTRRLGMPAYQTAQVLLYNRTWAKELGFIQPPASPDEYQAQACAASKSLMKDTNLDNHGKGGWIVSSGLLTDLDWISVFGGSITPGAKSGYALNRPQILDAFTYLANLFGKNCAWINKDDTPYMAFANRQALFYSAAVDEIALQEKANTAAKSQDEWTALPFAGNDGKPVLFATGPSYLLMVNEPPRQLAGWLFVRWMENPENQVDLVQATGVYPARLSVKADLKTYAAQHPQWASGLDWLADAQYPPSRQDWTRVAPIIQDAVGQIFSTTTKPLQPAVIVDMLDSSIQEVIQH